MDLKVGDVAPDFALPSSSGGKLRLSDLRGERVLLLFYPFAFSSICTGELCSLRDRAADFSDLGAQILGVSCDPMESLRAFAAQESLSHPLLSDFWPHGEVSRRYGVFVDFLGAADRGTFIIDREGSIAGIVRTELGRAREHEEYRRILAGVG
jgi:peroxiredoxin